MSRPFRTGDKVVRIKEDGYYGVVVDGVYTVSGIKNEDHICLKDCTSVVFGHSKKLFKLVEAKPFVKEDWI